MSKQDINSKAKQEIAEVKNKQSAFIREFKEFISRGNVVELAVGVAVGGAFTTIVNSLVNDIVMPIVGLLAGGVDFSNLVIEIPNFFGTGDHAIIAYGSFIQNVVNFLLIALCVFLVVRTMNRFNQRKEKLSEKLKAIKKD